MSFLERRKGIIFDLDNTLIPTAPAYKNAMKALEEEIMSSHNATEEQIAKFIIFQHQAASSSDVSKVKSQSEWFRKVIGSSLRKVVPQVKEHHITRLFHVYQSIMMSELVMTDALIDMLKRLRKDYKLAILTNGFSYFQNLKLERCNAKEYFDSICVSGDHDMMKPDPKLFHLACKQMGLINSQCIMVGDNLFTDILGAQNAGLKTDVHLPCMIDTRERNFSPTHTINDILDLETLLEKIQW